jgi:hypothetical protein
MLPDQSIELKIAALHERARQLLLEKKDPKEIVIELIKKGIEPGYAELIIENVKTKLSERRNFWIELGKGVIVTMVGLILNYFSYTTFMKGGAFHWIFYWGIVVFGISIMFRALIIFKK